MARSDIVTVVFEEGFFATVLRSGPVQALVDAAATRAMERAKATAPRDTGAYERSIHIEHHQSRYRRAARVEASDPKSLIIESRTGNLARALKAAKG